VSRDGEKAIWTRSLHRAISGWRRRRHRRLELRRRRHRRRRCRPNPSSWSRCSCLSCSVWSGEKTGGCGREKRKVRVIFAKHDVTFRWVENGPSRPHIFYPTLVSMFPLESGFHVILSPCRVAALTGAQFFPARRRVDKTCVISILANFGEKSYAHVT
jgi:hypothetical protein